METEDYKGSKVWSGIYNSAQRVENVTCMGYSDPWIQDRTQNFTHKNYGIGDFSLDYQNFIIKMTFSEVAFIAIPAITTRTPY